MIYGYARISRKSQNIERQIKNLQSYDKDIIIHQEAFTGTKDSDKRKEFVKLQSKLQTGDTIVFDSVSRMSRNSKDGIKKYFELLEKGIELIFLKEPMINTEIYGKKLLSHSNIKVKDSDLNSTIMQGIRDYLVILAKKQIEIAFNQAEKEVTDLQNRTKEGIREARAKGKQIGGLPGVERNSKRGKEIKEKIKKHSRAFNGSMTDKEFIEAFRCGKTTLIKYKRELKEEKWN